MERIEYHTLDKSDWPKGPWQDEPDKIQWPDKATGLPCLIVRHAGSGHLCGYVGVAKGHPWHGKDYDSIALDDGEDPDVHGGLTYAGICHRPGQKEPDDVWWLGFDCAHWGDQSGMAVGHTLPAELRVERGWETYKTVKFVSAQCARLAKQAAQVTSIK